MSDRIDLDIEDIDDLLRARDILGQHLRSVWAKKAYDALIIALKYTYLDPEK